MTSRSERRRACRPSAGDAAAPVAPAAATSTLVDATTGTSYHLGVLDEPLQVYRVLATFAADDLISDGDLGRAYCALAPLAPLACDWHDDVLVCELLCTAYSPEAAAWRAVERIREVVELWLVQVEAGLVDATAPEVVLTSNEPFGGAGREAALCS